MQFRILGPLEVLDGESVVPLAGGKLRALLAILLLSANEVVSSDRLLEALWGEHPPESGAKALQVRVSQLRKALGPAGSLILTRAPGYRLALEGEQLDVSRFDRLVAEAEDADPSLAAVKLREALALWRGPALADLAYESFAQPAIGRLEELRLAALENRIEADLALGREAELVGELGELAAVHPLRERFRAQLMLALYRAGRQSDALAVYRDTSEVLREELGLEPSRPLQELQLAILRQDPALQPARRGHALGRAGNLPVPSTSFLGRAGELVEITALLHSPSRLLTLTGAGGSGKTRLALEAATACSDEYADGAWFVGFSDIGDPELIASVICRALGVAEQPGLTPMRALGGWLEQREVLLVLDNLEQLAPGVGVLGELLAGCPGVRMLATSREPLRLAGEQQYEVPVLERDDAIELFCARARAVAPSLALERESVRAVCERLDRLPLAIELAAARTKLLSPAEILHRLERRLPVLGSGPRDAPRRQRTLRATIEWSYELLTETEQRLLTRLSVFAGGCTLDAAEAVCDAELDTLAALVDRSLVRAGGGRYRMLQTLREYALDELAQSGEEDQIRRRHARWFVELIQAHGFDASADPDPEATPALLEQERENFRGALEWAEQAEDIETVARLAAPLTFAWCEEGSLSEADQWLGLVRARSDGYPLELHAQVLSAARELAAARGAHHEAADLSRQALAAYSDLDDMAEIVVETLCQANSVFDLGDLALARALFEDSLRLARRHELNRWVAAATGNLAELEIAAGRLAHARALCEETLTLGPGVDSRIDVVAHINLAHIANLERRHADAVELAQEALGSASAIRYRIGAVAAALRLAWSLAKLQHPERAARLLGAALEFYRNAGRAMQWSDAACEQAIRDTLDAQLDEPTLRALIDEGRSMTVEQAVLERLTGGRAPRAIGLPRDERVSRTT